MGCFNTSSPFRDGILGSHGDLTERSGSPDGDSTAPRLSKDSSVEWTLRAPSEPTHCQRPGSSQQQSSPDLMVHSGLPRVPAGASAASTCLETSPSTQSRALVTRG